MQKNFIVALLYGFALLWHDLSLGYQGCPYYNTDQSFAIPNYNNSAYYYTNASLSCLDIAQFPLSSCLLPLSNSNVQAQDYYPSSSALASDPVGGRVFQSMYNPTNWTGKLLSYQANLTTGDLTQITAWEAGDVLTNKNNNNNPLNPYTFFHPDADFVQYCYYGAPDPHCINTSNNPMLKGYPFNVSNLSDSQINLIDNINKPGFGHSNNVEAYLSGSAITTNSQGDTLRSRPSLLGDLVNSDPLFVGSEDFNYSSLPESQSTDYPTFVNNKSQVASENYPRARMVYVGGNDGRLHGFEVGTWNRNTPNAFDSGLGTEVFSFLPGSILNNYLHHREGLFIPPPDTFATNNPLYHNYFVDGSPKAGDAYFSSNNTWRTVLLGTTGASPPDLALDWGGSIFALDITNPANPKFAAGNVLWEFTHNPGLIYDPINNPSYPYFNDWADGDLGMPLSQPSLARMQNGKWGVIVGNGYNSQNQLPILYILDITLTPKNPNFIIAKFSPCVSTTSINVTTNANPNGPKPYTAPSTITNTNYCFSGSPNGLSTPIAVDVNNDQKVDYIYAGDLQGNLWKFDVNCTGVTTRGDYLGCQSNSASADWQVANQVNGNAKPLFVACEENAQQCDLKHRQPITAKPQVGSVSSTQANTLYAANEATSPSSPNKPSVMVYFGTGSYLGLCDVESSITLGVTCPQQQNFTQQQTVYALWDRNQGTASTDNSIAGRSSLLQQTILTPSSITQNNTTTAVANVRVTSTASSNLPCYQTSCAGQTTNTTQSQQSGWYMDLSTPSNMPSERSVSFPNLLNGNIVFSTQLPTSTPCDPNTQASGWVMELDAITGNAPSNPVFLNIFGTNPLGKAPNYDLVTAKIGNATTTMAPSGIQSTVGILKTPALIYGQGVVHKYFGGSTGPTGPTTGIQMVTDPGSTQGRVSWLQLR